MSLSLSSSLAFRVLAGSSRGSPARAGATAMAAAAATTLRSSLSSRARFSSTGTSAADAPRSQSSGRTPASSTSSSSSSSRPSSSPSSASSSRSPAQQDRNEWFVDIMRSATGGLAPLNELKKPSVLGLRASYGTVNGASAGRIHSSRKMPSSNDAENDWRQEDRWMRRQLFGPAAPATPSTGRSVPVTGGDISRAFNRLNSILRDNNVRRELKLQDRYEKPTQTRRRLRSERHRRRFADMVRKKVQLVMAMKARGL